jgi:hypothetical protein
MTSEDSVVSVSVVAVVDARFAVAGAVVVDAAKPRVGFDDVAVRSA